MWSHPFFTSTTNKQDKEKRKEKKQQDLQYLTPQNKLYFIFIFNSSQYFYTEKF